jgi:transcriptional regulator with XRE-family HTH domain
MFFFRSNATNGANVFGARLRHVRERLGMAQEKLGVQIGIDESASRARISRYETGVHEPPIGTARLLAQALNVPLAYLYCDDDEIANLLLNLTTLPPATQDRAMKAFEQIFSRLKSTDKETFSVDV